MKLKKIL